MKNLTLIFQNKTILLTGHTGFKGSWLTAWLVSLGAKVVGIADCIPTQPAHFMAAQLTNKILHHLADINDYQAVQKIMADTQPDFVFHLAAQALVRRSYADPVQTFQTNIMGTVHVLDALRHLKKPCVAVMITSDKCYDNKEWVWGYRETDVLGGKDPYSASKGAAELAIRAYIESVMRDHSHIRLGIGRAGNVIGGGDWAEDRIVPDCVRAWSQGRSVEIRRPHATRPWQHVLEPLSGYLALAANLADSPRLHGEAFNFGPRAEQNYSVRTLLESLKTHWSDVVWQDTSDQKNQHYEAGLLKLNCDKALAQLNWQPTLNFEETVKLTAEWYKAFYHNPERCILDVTLQQLTYYIEMAKQKGIAWAC